MVRTTGKAAIARMGSLAFALLACTVTGLCGAQGSPASAPVASATNPASAASSAPPPAAPSSARASALERGVRAHEAGQFEIALQAWTEAAEAGSVAAAFNLGVMHDAGAGIPRKAALAADWYRRAAEAGDLSAQVALAKLMEVGGPDLSADAEEARLWYRIAAANQVKAPGDEDLRRQARGRLTAMPPAALEEIAFSGGRYLFRGLAAGRCIIALQGRIGPDATRTFRRVVEHAREKGCGDPWIALESGGGVVADGLELGREVHLAGYSTMVGRSCASACGFIFMGGRERILMGREARIGLHQASRTLSNDPGTRRCESDRFATVYRSIRNYLRMVLGEASQAIHERALQTPCESMTWVRGEEALAMRIATAVR